MKETSYWSKVSRAGRGQDFVWLDFRLCWFTVNGHFAASLDLFKVHIKLQYGLKTFNQTV